MMLEKKEKPKNENARVIARCPTWIGSQVERFYLCSARCLGVGTRSLGAALLTFGGIMGVVRLHSLLCWRSWYRQIDRNTCSRTHSDERFQACLCGLWPCEARFCRGIWILAKSMDCTIWQYFQKHGVNHPSVPRHADYITIFFHSKANIKGL